MSVQRDKVQQDTLEPVPAGWLHLDRSQEKLSGTSQDFSMYRVQQVFLKV